MSLLRCAKVAALCGAVVLAASFGRLAGVGPALVQTTAAVPVEIQRAALLPADVERADPPRPMGNVTIVDAEVAPTAEPETAVATDITAAKTDTTVAKTDTTVAKDESRLIVEAALPDSLPLPEAEMPLVQMASADPSDPLPIEVKKAVALIEIPDECLDSCIDRYLWTLYQRTPKEDSLRVHERRKVTIRRKGKMVTVTRTFTRLVDQDFTWKDPHAAEKVGMPMMDYVIGGMDRSFKTILS